MRAAACVSVFAFLGLIGACTLGGASATTAGTGGSTPAACTQTDGCDTCIACADEGPCASLYSACSDDSDCTYVYTCYKECTPGDTSCQSTCESDNTTGASSAEALIACETCDSCATACTGQCTTSE